MSSVPLTQAVTSGDAGAVSAVLANGADVNERTGGGQTPLILATIFGHTHLIPLLLEAGADPQLRDNLGLNAVDWAQRRGATEVIDVLNGKTAGTSPKKFETTAPARPARSARNPEVEKPRSVSEEERSRRWLAGLKQRIAEQSQSEIPDGPNIFRPQRESIAETQRKFLATEREPEPEMPGTPTEPQPESPAPATPQPEIPALPQEPEPEIPIVPPEPEFPSKTPKPELPGETPKPELPGKSPTPELPTEPPTPEPGTIVAASSVAAVAETATAAAEKTPRKSSTRKRCPQCNAIYNSDLVAYCAHHFVPLVDADIPIISEPQKPPAVMFWVMIVITLTGSIVIGSLITAYFYNSQTTTQQAASSPPAAVQKGTPALDETLEGKAVSLPIAECPLNGQEAIPGTVVVHVIIDKTGQVQEAEASGGDWLLRGAAAEAAMKSTFAPDKLRGRETEGTITYTFEP